LVGRSCSAEGTGRLSLTPSHPAVRHQWSTAPRRCALGLAQQLLELGKELLNGIKVKTMGTDTAASPRAPQEPCAYRKPCARPEVPHYEAALPEHECQKPLNPGGKISPLMAPSITSSAIKPVRCSSQRGSWCTDTHEARGRSSADHAVFGFW
jgi:hypothetical protein